MLELNSDKHEKRFCFNLGYPSLDIIKNNTKNNSAFNEIKNRNLHIIWTPRWTTDESACGTTFFEYKDKIIKYGKKQRDLIVFRPHPLAFDIFIEKGLMTKKEVTDYLKNYQNSNMIYDKSSDYYDTFRDSDVLITDFSSIIIEYLMYNKPIIFCHRNMDMMNDYMKIMSNVLYHAKNWKEIEKILKMLKSGKDPLKKERIEFIEKNFSMYDGKVKNRIVDQVKKDYYKKK